MDAAVRPHDLTPPTEGAAIDIAPGVRWLRMPLPFPPSHINLYLLDEGDGWTVVDTGLNTKRTRAAWEGVFANALDGKPVKRVIVTHFHLDHMGLAHWVCARWSAPLWMTQAEWLWAAFLVLFTGEPWETSSRDYFNATGTDPDLIDAYIAYGNFHASSVGAVPPGYRRIRDGEELILGGRRWQVIAGHGHSPEHACLYGQDSGVLLSGDIILPNITPNLSVWPAQPDQDTIGEYLDCLSRFRHLPTATLVLPAHGDPFTGLQGRLDQLAHHHDWQLDNTLAGCAEPASAWQVSRRLFPSAKDPLNMILGVGEAVAHLNHLMTAGKILRASENGVWRYRRNG